jgi:hypothetical protein
MFLVDKYGLVADFRAPADTAQMDFQYISFT